MIPIDYSKATLDLNTLFTRPNEMVLLKSQEYLDSFISELDALFNSRSQSFRETLLGCALAHLINPSIDVRSPYAKQSEKSFNGRTLDETVINPFLQANKIPCSKGPYLAVFRRNVTFTEKTRDGIRDRIAYDAMLMLLSVIESIEVEVESAGFVRCLLSRFLMLRDQSRVPIVFIERLSIAQYSKLFQQLEECPSGGLLPVLLTVALFQTIQKRSSSQWQIGWQGINSADCATGAEGDITIKNEGDIFLAIEVTERPIDEIRVNSTFNTKILSNRVRNYLFIYTKAAPQETAQIAGSSYFTQGYNINFAHLHDLVINQFLISDEAFRKIYMLNLIDLLDNLTVPSSVKVFWNDNLKRIAGL